MFQSDLTHVIEDPTCGHDDDLDALQEESTECFGPGEVPAYIRRALAYNLKEIGIGLIILGGEMRWTNR